MKSALLDRVERAYFLTAVLILTVTAVAKLLSISATEPIWKSYDPIFGITYKPLFISFALIELALATGLLLRLPALYKHGALGFFAFAGFCYHGARAFAEVPAPCPCLGNLFRWLPSLDSHSTTIALTMLGTFGTMSLLLPILRSVSRPARLDATPMVGAVSESHLRLQ